MGAFQGCVCAGPVFIQGETMNEKSYFVEDEEQSLAMLQNGEFIEAFAACVDILGACFLFHPVKEQAAQVFPALVNMDIALDWPFGEERDRREAASLLREGQDEFPREVGEEFTRLLRGPGIKPAPAWGSVYMDRDKVMYGRTWHMLRDWMREHGVKSLYEANDPEDQFGRLLMLCAQIARSRADLLCELLGEHVLCWSERFLSQFYDACETNTYRGLALLCRTTLRDVQSLLSIEPAVRRMYR